MKKLVIKRISEKLVKTWKEMKSLKNELMDHLEKHQDIPELIARYEALKTSFWFDLKRKYHLEKIPTISLNPITYHVFIKIDKNSFSKAVARISDDLIERQTELESLKKMIDNFINHVNQLKDVIIAKGVIFWQDVEKEYNLKGKSLTIDPETFSIYEEETEPSLPLAFDFFTKKPDDSLVN